MHLKRWLTAAVVAPLLICLIYFSANWFFAVFVAVAALVALAEYYSIVFVTADPGWLIRGAGFAATGGIVLAGLAGRFEVIALTAWGLLLFTAACILVWYARFDRPLAIVLRQVAGLIYLALPLSLAVMIYTGPGGSTWIFLLLIVVFLGDTGAYYAGTYGGRHKLLPAVSPGKTVEGALGGLLTSVAAGCLLNLALPVLPWDLAMPRLNWPGLVFFLVAISVCGQMGDLFESVLKREAQVKDSGGIFPGHGGLLDRIDAVLFALPVAYLFKTYLLNL